MRRLSCCSFLAVLIPAVWGCASSDDGRTPSTNANDFTETQLSGASMPNKTVALTFDDGPGPRTVELAEYLHARNIQATFFVVGQNAAGATDTLQKLKDNGHLVGNHTYTHADIAATADPIGEVRRTDAVIAPYVTDNIFLFRAPYGDWSARVADVLNQTDLRKYVGSIFWDIGGELSNGFAADWACWGQGVSTSDCGDMYVSEANYRGRGIILMHDSHSQTIDMVIGNQSTGTPGLVDKLLSAGFQFVRADAVPSIAKAMGKPVNVQCVSNTLQRMVDEGVCVQSSSDKAWYQCRDGSWATADPATAGCKESYPVDGGASTSPTLPENACQGRIGWYCGASPQFSYGDSKTRYLCANNALGKTEPCPNGCHIADPGQDDTCN